MRAGRLGAAMLLACLAHSTPARAQDFAGTSFLDFEGPSPLADRVARSLGGRIEGGRLLVAANAKALRGPLSLLTLEGAGLRAASVTVTARVPAESEGGHGPGLLIRGRIGPDGPSGFSLIRTRTGYMINGWRDGSVTQTISGTMPPAVEGTPARLAARETADGAAFFVEGWQVATVSGPEGDGDGVGLLAMGAGLFTFDDYGFNDQGRAGEGQPAPMPPVPPWPQAGSPPDPTPGFWIGEGGRQVGPLTQAQLRERAASGVLGPGTLVWQPGMPGWLPAGQVPALAGLLLAAPVPLAPGPAPAALDPGRFMPGLWDVQADFDMPSGGKVRLVLAARYQPDGSATARGTARSGPETVPVQVTGTWRTRPLAADRFALAVNGILTLLDGSGRPSVRPLNDDTVVRVLGPDAAELERGFMRRRQSP